MEINQNRTRTSVACGTTCGIVKSKQHRKTLADKTTAHLQLELLQTSDKENLPGKPDKKNTCALRSKGETHSQPVTQHEPEGGSSTAVWTRKETTKKKIKQPGILLPAKTVFKVKAKE